MIMNQIKWLLMLSILFSSFAFAKGVKQNVVFPKGENGTTIDRTVLRGDQDIYTLRANAGQTMRVEITSTENNAVFVIYQPNAQTLPNAGEGQDATFWEGKLPAKGAYKIEVGGTRGNADYSLTIVID
jgi:hypothetical protein